MENESSYFLVCYRLQSNLLKYLFVVIDFDLPKFAAEQGVFKTRRRFLATRHVRNHGNHFYLIDRSSLL
jgi:hypothetical protein